MLGVLAAVLLTACAATEDEPMTTDAISVTSAAFEDGGTIPARHSCDGQDVSPPLEWSGAPDGTAAYALIVDDPDARGFVHWLLADIPADRTSLDEGSSAGTEGRNDFGRPGWGGPCPPSGSHRYAFTIHALSEPTALRAGFTADELRAALDGKTLASGQLAATYSRDR